MIKFPQWQRKIALLVMLSVCIILVACGDESVEESSASSSTNSGVNAGTVLICIAYLLVSGDDECLSYVSSSSSSGGSGSSGSSNTTGSSNNTVSSDDVIRFRPIDEYEPNNDWLNANVVEFPRTTDRDGFIIDGEVRDEIDPVDVFTFTRTFLRYHAFRLCWHGDRFCDETGEVDTPTAFIEILDPSGNVLASTQGNDTNYLRLELAGGVPNYVRVVAHDTMAAPFRYHLAVHEANY
jgi:hypothetical protein